MQWEYLRQCCIVWYRVTMGEPEPQPSSSYAVEDHVSEDRFAAYKGVRDITIKKGSTGLGIMIIEGRHTEAGRGMFVSDLQEGSAAEQAGLQIGDMILAVNRDSLLTCTYEGAAAKLKQTEGVVVLTVCSPNMKDGDKAEKSEDPTSGSSGATAASPSPAAVPGGSASRPASRNQTPDPGALATQQASTSRPQTPRPAPSPVRAEPPPDPATAPIVPNQETVIEITPQVDILGVVLLGGSDTLLNGPAAVILDIYANGSIAKDGRLRVGDQIRECNGVQITKEMCHGRLCMSVKQRAPKLKLTVYRPEPIVFDEIEVELTGRPGRPMGLACVAPIQGTGVYLSDALPASPAELDGRLQRGDLLVSVDGRDLTTADYLTAATALELCGPRAVIKVRRFKIVR